MRQGWLLGVITSAVVGGGVLVSAQGTSAPAKRPFERLFTTIPAPRPAPSLAPPAIDLSPRLLQRLPSGTKCHIMVIPADPRIDPRMSIAPPASRRFTIREVPPVCR